MKQGVELKSEKKKERERSKGLSCDVIGSSNGG
jgi:hypothetical protein